MKPNSEKYITRFLFFGHAHPNREILMPLCSCTSFHSSFCLSLPQFKNTVIFKSPSPTILYLIKIWEIKMFIQEKSKEKILPDEIKGFFDRSRICCLKGRDYLQRIWYYLLFSFRFYVVSVYGHNFIALSFRAANC